MDPARAELAATLFNIDPPLAWSNGRELLQALIHDCARASGGELAEAGNEQTSLVLPSWARKDLESHGLYRLVDLRFRVLWPRSDSPGLEVCAGNRFMRCAGSSGRHAIPTSPAEIHEHFPEAARWLRNASDLSLKTHIHAASVWFRAAQRAGWAPRRIPLNPITYPEPQVQSGRGMQSAQEPFKSIILAKAPIRSPRRIDLTLVGRSIGSSAVAAVESAFRRWWPSLPVAIRTANIAHRPTVEPPDLALLLIPDGEDIHHPSWIDWLRTNEATGKRFRISRESSLQDSSACTNLTLDLFMLAGGVPWTALVDKADRTVLGLDAGHNRDHHWSRWVCAQVDVDRNEVSCTTVRTELAEHIPDSSIDRLLPSGRSEWNATVFRDGRFHTESRQQIAPNGMAVSVVKHPERSSTATGTAPFSLPDSAMDSAIPMDACCSRPAAIGTFFRAGRCRSGSASMITTIPNEQLP